MPFVSSVLLLVASTLVAMVSTSGFPNVANLKAVQRRLGCEQELVDGRKVRSSDGVRRRQPTGAMVVFCRTYTGALTTK